MIQDRFKKRVVLICDDEKAREMYGHAIDSSSTNSTLIQSYPNCSEASTRIVRDFADIVVIGTRFFGSIESEFVSYIKETYPKTEFLLILEGVDSEQVFDILSIGISGIVLKNTGLVSILQAIEDVSKGWAYLSPNLTRRLVESYWINQFSPLTNRETEVLKSITEGKSYSEIASQLHISSETAKTHIRSIYKKLKVNSKSEVVKRAITDKLVPMN